MIIVNSSLTVDFDAAPVWLVLNVVTRQLVSVFDSEVEAKVFIHRDDSREPLTIERWVLTHD